MIRFTRKWRVCPLQGRPQRKSYTGGSWSVANTFTPTLLKRFHSSRSQRLLALSPFHFHRGFTKAFGQTPHSYVTGLRLAEALRLLESGASALDACLDVGFSSPSAFSRLFRAQFGEPPSAIRRKFARLGKNQHADSSTLFS
jgi:AraC-like DNA-binding protein